MTKALIKIRNFFSSDKMLFTFALAYLILSFLTFTFITANVYYLKYLSYAISIWGFIIIVFSLFHKSKWTFNLITILALLFILSFFISSIFTFRYGISENLKGLIWLSLELIILFLLNKGNINSNYLKYFFICFIFISTLYSILSILMAVIGYMHYPTSTLGDTAAGGMAHGRLYGLYSDPNYGAITSVLCIFSLLFILSKNKDKFKIIISVLISIIQLIYIALSGSRSGLVALIISIFICMSINLKICKNKKLLTSILAALLTTAFCLGIYISTESIYEVVEPQILKTMRGPITNPIHAYTVQFADKVRDECGLVNPYIPNNGTGTTENSEQNQYIHGESISEHVGLLGRNENQDISNNRISIWKASLELFFQSPIIGLSNRNYSDFCIQNLPENYLSKVQWTSLHNTFIDVLVSQGILGLIIWCGILLIIFISIIKNIRKNKTDARYIILLGIFICLMIMCMFYSELIYVNTIGSVYFWYTFSHIEYTKIRKRG